LNYDSHLKLQALVTRYTQWDEKNSGYEEHYVVLVSTKEYSNPKKIVMYYDLRVKTEERFRQLKRSWYISDFTSPHASLIESHLFYPINLFFVTALFTARRITATTHQMIETLRKDERLGKNAVLVYASHHYGVVDLDDYMFKVTGLTETPRQRLIAIM
jgi:hypothetical protein